MTLAAHSARTRDLRTRQGAWLFALALFGYPLVGNLVSLLDIDSRSVSIPFRLVVAALSLWLLFSRGNLRVDGLRALLAVIATAYLLRLVFDAAFTDVGGAGYALQFFIAGCLLPALALWKLDVFDAKRFSTLSFVVCTMGCLASLAGSAFGAFGETDLTEITGRLGTVALNPVSLGHLAASGLICGVVLWRFADVQQRLMVGGAMLMMGVVLAQTGSKGPALAIVAALALWSIRRGLFTRFAAAAIVAAVVATAAGNNPLLDRIVATEEDLSTLDRLVLIQDSIQQIVDQPWLGSSFVELKSGYYPHSILLEAPMAMGIPLSIVLAFVLWRGLAMAWRSMNAHDDLIGMLFIQGLISAATAGALFGATSLWVPLVLLLHQRRHEGMRPRQRRRSARAMAPAVTPEVQ